MLKLQHFLTKHNINSKYLYNIKSRIRLLLGLSSLLRWSLFGSWFLRWFRLSSSFLGGLWFLGGRLLGLLGGFGFLSSLGLLSLGFLGLLSLGLGWLLGFFGQFIGSLDLDQSLRFHSLFQSLANEGGN